MNKSVVYEFTLQDEHKLDYPKIYERAAECLSRMFDGFDPSLEGLSQKDYYIEVERLGEIKGEKKSFISYKVKVMGFLLAETERYVESGISHNGDMLYRKIKREVV